MNVSTSVVVCSEFLRVMIAVKGEIMALTEAYGITLPQLRVLHVLYEEGPLMMGALAEQMYCDASNITTIIDKLVAHGYVIRRALPTDRRAKCLTLTPEAIAMMEQVFQQLPSTLGFDALNSHELDTLHQLLQRIKNA